MDSINVQHGKYNYLFEDELPSQDDPDKKIGVKVTCFTTRECEKIKLSSKYISFADHPVEQCMNFAVSIYEGLLENGIMPRLTDPTDNDREEVTSLIMRESKFLQRETIKILEDVYASVCTPSGADVEA